MSDQTPPTGAATEAEPTKRAGQGAPTRAAHREAHSGPRLWARARGAFFALPRGLHVVILIIFMILGFALATQVRAQRSDPLEGLSEQDLVTLLDELGTQEQNLRGRRGELSEELANLQSAASEADAREQASAKAALQAQIAAGTVAVHGPGVSVTVVDPGSNLSPTQFVMTLGELRNAGAVVVDGIPISAPDTWTVIGDSQTISTALEIQAGSASQMRAKGATVTISQTDDVTIDSLATPRPAQYATYE